MPADTYFDQNMNPAAAMQGRSMANVNGTQMRPEQMSAPSTAMPVMPMGNAEYVPQNLAPVFGAQTPAEAQMQQYTDRGPIVGRTPVTK